MTATILTTPAPVTIRGANLRWRNFTGRASKFNAEGARNFCVFLDEKQAVELAELGWNVKTLVNKEDPDELQAYMQISVGYKAYPPKITLVTSGGKTDLEEGVITALDWFEILKVDLTFRAYRWTVKGETGIKAYLKTMFFTVLEDELIADYKDVPEIGAAPMLAIDNFIEGQIVEEIE